MCVVSVAIVSEFESYYMVPVNFHRMVLSLHYCRDPKNTFQVSPEGCVVDRGGYRHHPVLSLHLEKNKWLKLGDLARWICLGVLCGPLSATAARVLLAVICYRSPLLQYMDDEGTPEIKVTGRNLLDSRKQAMWLTSSSRPECVAFTSAAWGCWNPTPCVLTSITRSVLGECMESVLRTSH